ncbi:hypothetical protein H6A24_00535 [Bacteroides caecicola]|uniref:Uncharacterized protein n=1 Tax=Bacteroides caecicola TaxID=1462569 RepID=A0ABS2F4Q9_9BACE|nr:hypothetical protein [Bacteroides caecicola]MBM6805003.1 hypothetical protein [Bacteroides caecicola]
MGKDDIILWIQGESVHNDDILSCKGKRIDKSSDCYIRYYKLLVYTNHCHKLREKPHWISLYKGKIGIDNGSSTYYLLYGHYKEVDTANRPIGFMSYVRTNNIEDALNAVINESKLYGYSISDEDMAYIKKKSIHKITIAIVMAILCLICLILCL